MLYIYIYICRVFEGAANNQPDRNAELAAREIMNLVRRSSEDELVIALISGGGSALLPCPVSGVPLEEKQHVRPR